MQTINKTIYFRNWNTPDKQKHTIANANSYTNARFNVQFFILFVFTFVVRWLFLCCYSFRFASARGLKVQKRIWNEDNLKKISSSNLSFSFENGPIANMPLGFIVFMCLLYFGCARKKNQQFNWIETNLIDHVCIYRTFYTWWHYNQHTHTHTR